MRDGKLRRVQKSKKLAKIEDLNKKNPRVQINSEVVKELFTEFMREVNRAAPPSSDDMSIADFWEKHFLPYYTEPLPKTGLPRLKPSTVYGYKQIWNQHFKPHFGELKLREYTSDMASQLLESLTGTQVKTTLKHIRAVGSVLFKRALKGLRPGEIAALRWEDIDSKWIHIRRSAACPEAIVCLWAGDYHGSLNHRYA